MVRVSRVRDSIEDNLRRHIRRVYPVVRGLNQWGDLTEKRDMYFSNEFKLVQEPLIEAIPQYQPGQGSRPNEFVNNAENASEERRLRGLGELLTLSGVNYSLYDHQMKSIMAQMRDQDVVVATGTGSGKTESFLFPMINHLHDEALRCSDSDEAEKSERAVKCLILYPMNALVADQLSRLRELLGNPELSTMLLRKGYGRFPQFGMYTGRTDYHGWFSVDTNADNEGEEEEWERNKKTDSISDYISKLGKLRERQVIWESLVEKHKIPSIGGRVYQVTDEDEETTLAWDELSVRAQLEQINACQNVQEKRDLENRRYKIEPHEDQFKRFSDRDYPQPSHDANQYLSDNEMAHIARLGDCLDRELIARYQMHLGGVSQYVKQKYGAEKGNHIMEHLGVGIPDVMVTNYSMLEYMLMRPLEHTFWHNTKEWLHGCNLANDDPMRRKLLLVVDEAHLYKGAMGTEFSLLLNRLLNVLEVGRDRMQFIITSASLGEDEDAKMEYVSGLLSLHGEEYSDRRDQIEMPESTIMNVPNDSEINKIAQSAGDQNIAEWLNQTELRLPTEIVEELIQISQMFENNTQEETEREALNYLFDDEKINEYLHTYTENGMPEDLFHQNLAYDCITNWPLAYRLKRLLLNPNGEEYPLSQSDRESLEELYEGVRIQGTPTDNFPRRYEILKNFLFENPDIPESDLALDLILDIIASARPYKFEHGTWKSGKSFLPLRMHLLVRGDSIPVICPGCGYLSSEGTSVCNNVDCEGYGQFRTYQAYIDRNCGGISYVVV